MAEPVEVFVGPERRGDVAAAPEAEVWAWPVHKACVGGWVGLCDRACSGGPAACDLWDGMLYFVACMPHAHAPCLDTQPIESVITVEKQLERHWR